MNAAAALLRCLLPGCLLFSPLAQAGPAPAEEGVVQLLDASGDGKGHALAAPRGLALDGRGNLYVAGFLVSCALFGLSSISVRSASHRAAAARAGIREA